jgi:hypothetical protein
MIDFLVGSVDHNIQYGAPINSFNKYLPVITKSLETYEAKSRGVSEKEMVQHVIAKKLRLAQLMIDNRNYTVALVYIKEGLEISPNNKELLELKKVAESKK